MAEITIVGGGFSAYLAMLLVGKGAMILSCSDFVHLGPNQIQRRKVFEVNKLFGKKAYSATKLKPSLKKLKLHDRLISGGNSNIWGGVIDVSNLPRSIIKLLKKSGVMLQPLSYENTGSISNKPQYAQLINTSGNIIDVSEYLQGCKNYFLDSFFIEGDRIGLRIIQSRDNNHLAEIIYTKQLIICTGVVQTIDLLYRSGFLKEGDELTLCEYGHQIYITPTLRPEVFKDRQNEAIVRFDLARAFCHFLGIQKRLWPSNIFRYVPLFIDQKFTAKKSQYLLKIVEGEIVEVLNNLNKDTEIKSANGASIHYCNLKINGNNANKYLNSIYSGLAGLGMAFVSQSNPGPISNDIALDALIKIKGLKN